MPISEYLESTGLSDGAINMIGAFTNSDELFETSILENIRDEMTLSENSDFYSIVGGSERLVDALFRSLENGTVRLNSDVTEIRQQSTKAGIPVQARVIFSDKNGEKKTMLADRVLITTTAAAVLTKISFSPALPAEKVTAMRQLHYDSASKIVLRFSRRFWELDDGICGGHSTTDLPIRFVWYPSTQCNSTNDDEEGALIASYTWGQDSLRFVGLADDAAVKLALDNLVQLHGEHIRASFLNGTVKHWMKDPYALGAFTLFTPLQEEHLSETLATRCDLVHFAGEHTIPDGHAWVAGSQASAIREALAINDDGQSFDVAIIGGGPVGLATAWQAAISGLKVVVIEKFDFGNQNSSSSSDFRQFREMYEQAYLAKLAIRSVPLWRKLEDDAGMRRGALLSQSGYLFFGDVNMGDTIEGNFEKIIETSMNLSLDVRVLDHGELQAGYSSAFRSLPESWRGMFHAESGFNDVRATMSALLFLCRKLGVVLREWESVEEIGVPSPNLAVPLRVNTTRGSVLAKRVVLVPGPFATEMLEKHFKLQLNAKLWEIPWLYFRAINETAASALPSWYAFGGTQTSLFYGFPLARNATRLLVGPSFVFKKFDHPEQRDGKGDLAQINATRAFVREHMAHIIDPDDVEIAEATCLASHLSDGGFLLDFMPDSHSRIALFTAGWGFKFVPAIGEILAHMASNGRKPGDFVGEKFSIHRDGVLASVRPPPPNDLTIYVGAGVGAVVLVVVVAVMMGVLIRRTRRRRKVAQLTNGDGKTRCDGDIQLDQSQWRDIELESQAF